MKRKKNLWIVCSMVAAFAVVTVSATLVAAGQREREEIPLSSDVLSDGGTESFILPDDIVLPEQTETAPAETAAPTAPTVPPSSTAKPTDAAPSGDTVKPADHPASDSVTEPARTAKPTSPAPVVLPPATRQLTVDGETFTLNYVKTEKEEGTNQDRCFYTTADGSVATMPNGRIATFDSVTGKCVGFWITNEERQRTVLPEDKITVEEAREIADRIIKDAGFDISRCTFDGVTRDGRGDFYIDYALRIDGIKTSERYYVALFEDGKVMSYQFSPNVYDNVDISRVRVDRAQMREKLLHDLKRKDYRQITEGIIMDQNGKMQLEFFVSFPQDPVRGGSYETYYYPIEY